MTKLALLSLQSSQPPPTQPELLPEHLQGLRLLRLPPQQALRDQIQGPPLVQQALPRAQPRAQPLARVQTLEPKLDVLKVPARTQTITTAVTQLPLAQMVQPAPLLDLLPLPLPQTTITLRMPFLPALLLRSLHPQSRLSQLVLLSAKVTPLV